MSTATIDAAGFLLLTSPWVSPAPPASLMAAIQALCRVTPGLAGLYQGAVWFRDAPPGATYPYGTYADVGAKAEVNTTAAYYERTLYQFSFFAVGDQEAAGYGTALINAFVAGWRGLAFADGYIMGFRLMGRQLSQLPKPLKNSPVAYRQDVTFMVTVGRNPS